MKLSPEQQAMLDGDHGWPRRIAMEMLVAVGHAYDAERLIPVKSSHLVIDGTALGEPGLRFLEKLVDEGGRFVIPTTINAIAVNRGASARDTLTDEELSQIRTLEACEKMGCLSSCSCNPFIQGFLPDFGEAVAWSESATSPYVNSVLGARTNREGATAVASALTGLTPEYGMHLDAERKGSVLFDIAAPISGLHRYNLLGALIGRRCAGRVPVITGLDAPSRDELIGFGAAFAIHGSANMYHLVGITPEAPTVEAAMGQADLEHIRINEADILDEWRRTQSEGGSCVDIVSVGCPHASLDQIAEVTGLIAGRRVNDNVTFFVHTNESVLATARREGLVDKLTAAGVMVTADNCAVVSYEKLPSDASLATNSAKMAFLASATSGVGILYGGVDDCVEAAVSGNWRGTPA